jgi:hypothetical protein
MCGMKTHPWIAGAVLVTFLCGCEHSGHGTRSRPAPSAPRACDCCTPPDSCSGVQFYTYDVVVLDARNHLVPGALVIVSLDDYGTLGRGYTGYDGGVSFGFGISPSAHVYISVQSPGYLPVVLSEPAGRHVHQTHYVILADY